MITGENLATRETVIGMVSTGVFTVTDFSLVRKVFDMTKDSLNTYYDELGATLGETLLAPDPYLRKKHSAPSKMPW